MKSQFTEQLTNLERLVIRMGSLVETQVTETIEAMIRQDMELAERVIRKDREIDALEVDIDEEVLSILALHQPVAFDLRDIIGISKINSDMERIGDHALNIAESIRHVIKMKYDGEYGVVPKMADVVRSMLRDSIDSFIHKDAELAMAVCRRDDEIDQLNKHMFADILASMIKNPNVIPSSMELIRISKNLERIADLCTNICEDVVFIRNAKDIKHSHKKDQEPSGS